MVNYKVKLTLTEMMLGSSPKDEDIYTRFIGNKAPNAATLEEEVEALGVDEVAERGMTAFPRTEDGKPFVYDYQIKGFFKDACSMLSRASGKDPETGKKIQTNESTKLKAFKKEIDGLVFVTPREIPLQFDGEVGRCQRPLRAMTMQGERVSLACSETVPAGTTLEFTVKLLRDDLLPAVKEWLDYGELRGLGQWRNSGVGRFVYEEVKE